MGRCTQRFRALRESVKGNNLELIRYIWRQYDPDDTGWPSCSSVEIKFGTSVIEGTMVQLGSQWISKLHGSKAYEYRLTPLASIIAEGYNAVTLLSRFLELVKSRVLLNGEVGFGISLSEAGQKLLLSEHNLQTLKKLLRVIGVWGYLDDTPEGCVYKVADTAARLCEVPSSQMHEIVLTAVLPSDYCQPETVSTTSERVQQNKNASSSANEKRSARDDNPQDYISSSRIDELQSINSDKFDVRRLVQMCLEINSCARNENIFALCFLQRALLDHVPPIFGEETFASVVSNCRGRSIKDVFEKLDHSLRKTADRHLHQVIRKKESLPTMIQVSFRS